MNSIASVSVSISRPVRKNPYDLLTQASTVLGPDRYASFDQTSRNAMDNSFDDFGLARHRREVVPVNEPSGNVSYKFTGSFVYDAINDPEDDATRSGSSTTTDDAPR